MNHRTEIRKAIKAALDNPSANIAEPVELSRPNPILLSNAPIILVYPGDEENQTLSGSELMPKQYQRMFNIVIEIITYETPELDDYLDRVCNQIEFALFKDPLLGLPEIVLGMKLSSTKPLSFSDESERVYYGATMYYTIPYNADMYPDTKYPDFDSYYMAITSVTGEEAVDQPVIAANVDLTQ